MANLKNGNERKPKPEDLVPITYVPANSLPHFIADGENWQSLGARYGRPAQDIIQWNFKTSAAEEINWYLREYVNCDKPTADGYNWRFSTSARNGPSPRAGKIFIIPNWTLILNAAKKATRDAVQDWFRTARLTSASVNGAALLFPIGCVTSILPSRYLFVKSLCNGGASDAIAESWADFLEMILREFTRAIQGEELNAFPFFDNWRLPTPPPPMQANPIPLLMKSTGDPFVQRMFLRTMLKQYCGIQDPAGVDMVNAYATWFEHSFHTFRGAVVANGILGTVFPMAPGLANQKLWGTAFAAPGFLKASPMPL